MTSKFTRTNSFLMGIGATMLLREVVDATQGGGSSITFAALGAWLVLDAVRWADAVEEERKRQ